MSALAPTATKSTSLMTQDSQLSLFGLKDSRFSNLLIILNITPIYDRRQKNYSLQRETDNATHSYVTEHEDITYSISVTGASISRRNKKTKKTENVVFWPGDREERIVDAIMKIASGGALEYIEEDTVSGYGVYFTTFMIRQLTGMHHSDITEGIQVLNKANLEVEYFENNKKLNVSAPFLPVKYMSSDTSGRRNDRCYVIFHPIVKGAVDNLQYRPYIYANTEKYKRSLARYIHKRLNIRYTYAKKDNTHNFRLRRLMNDFGKVPEDQELTKVELNNLKRDVRLALLDIVDNKVIDPSFKVTAIKNEETGTIIDYRILVKATNDFIDQQKKANAMIRDKKIEAGIVLPEKDKKAIAENGGEVIEGEYKVAS